VEPEADTSSQIPETYDQYYLPIVRSYLKYACPIAAVLFVGFALVDWQLIPSFEDRLKALSMRLCFTGCLLIFWFLAPRIRSLKIFVACQTALYLFCLLTLIAVLRLIPDGLMWGASSLLVATMTATGMFFLRPTPATIAGMVGVMAFVWASLSAGLPPAQVTALAVNWAAAVLASSAFLLLLDRRSREKHALELSLAREKKQSETLLKEILPRYVIQRIKDGAGTIADSMSEVNVIFIDIVGFTALSRRLAPKHLVEVLAEVFGMLDNICEKYGVTKIKTIGDAYMAATGTQAEAHLTALAAVQFCLEGISIVDSIGTRIGIPLSVRSGIATGGVICGVLSLKRPAYDLWGETVNLASRMQTISEPGTIQIAETTYWRVKEKFQCEQRELIDIKGIGPIQTYLIRNPIGQARQAASGRLSV
jgi:adenylate cyclase